MTDANERKIKQKPKQQIPAFNSAELVANACLNKGRENTTKTIGTTDDASAEFSEESNAKAKDS